MPLRLTFCVLPGALSAMLTSPVRIPLLVGLNDTLIVQLFPTANPFPQLFVCRKSPLTEIVEIFILELPMLLNRTFFAGLVCPIGSPPNFNAVGRRLGAGALKYKNTTF